MSNITPAYTKLAEERIRQAIEKGEFDDLEGKGKPLNLEDDRMVPQDLRMAYKILKNADCLPPELELRKEIVNTQQLLGSITDTREKYRQLQKLNYLIMKLNTMRKVSPLLEESQLYHAKVVDRISVAEKKESDGKS